MTLAELITIFGSRAKLAVAIGEGPSTVRNWFNRGSMPWEPDDRIIAAAGERGHRVTLADLREVRREIGRRRDRAKGRVRGHADTTGDADPVSQDRDRSAA